MSLLWDSWRFLTAIELETFVGANVNVTVHLLDRFLWLLRCKLDFGTMHNEWFRDHGYIFIEDIDDQDGAVGYTTKCIRYAMKNQCLAYDDPRRKQENDPHPMTAFKLSKALIKQ